MMGFHLDEKAKEQILAATRIENRVVIEDAVNTLIYMITLHFVGSSELQLDRSRKLLINLKCPTLSHLRWYKKVFFFYAKVFTKIDCNADLWKKKKKRFLSGLLSLFAENV